MKLTLFILFSRSLQARQSRGDVQAQGLSPARTHQRAGPAAARRHAQGRRLGVAEARQQQAHIEVSATAGNSNILREKR